MLTTKLFCGYCGALLFGECGTGRSGVTHHYYKCASVKRKSKECSCRAFRKQWLEDLVVTEAMDMLSDDRVIDAIVSMVMVLQDQENTSLPLLERQLQEADSAIENMLNAIQQGILTRSTKTRLEELEASRDNLEAQIALEKMAKPRITEEQVSFFLKRFRKLDVAKLEHRKILIDIFLNAIYIYNDHMDIAFNYKEGTKTINFSDMECALSQRASAPGSDLEFSPVPRQNNTIRSPAAAGGVRSTDGVVFPFQTGGLAGVLRFGLYGSFEFVMMKRAALRPLPNREAGRLHSFSTVPHANLRPIFCRPPYTGSCRAGDRKACTED